MKRSTLVLLCLAIALAINSQSNEKRIALIIGNAAYQNGGALKNPVNDANLMATTLKGLGFEVILKTNATLKTMQSATVDFTNKITNYDVALFFYAGHGVQVDGENYLVPVDAQLNDKVNCQFEAFNINFINRAFQENQSHLNVMILDACRNNPFRSWMRGGSRGFQAVKNQAAGTIIAFATREGETASDGSGNNGLFTEKLVKQMNKAQNITEVFQNTRVDVLKESENTQCPQEWNMLTGNFYFKHGAVDVGNTNTTNNNQPEEVEFNAGNVEIQYGSISIDSEIGGDLYLDGKKFGTIQANSKGNKLNKITTGSHTIEIKGQENFEQSATVVQNQTAYITAKSSKQLSNTGAAKDLPNQLLDSRDNKYYKITKIGNQVWMAENLAFNYGSGCWAYDNNLSNVTKYGYLYNWETAKNVCPSGWHLPSEEEFETLLNQAGGSGPVAYNSLKQGGNSGFSAPFGGWRYTNGNFNSIGETAYFWSSSPRSDEDAWGLGIDSSHSSAGLSHYDRSVGFSVRCLRD